MKLRDPFQRLVQRARGLHLPDFLDPGSSSSSPTSSTSPGAAILRSLGRPAQQAVVMLSDGSVVFVPAGTSAQAVLEAHKGVLLSAFPCDALRPDAKLEGGKTYFMEEAASFTEDATADSPQPTNRDLHAQRKAPLEQQRQQQEQQQPQQHQHQGHQCPQHPHQHQHQHKHYRQYSWHPQQQPTRGQEWQQAQQQTRPQRRHHQPQHLDQTLIQQQANHQRHHGQFQHQQQIQQNSSHHQHHHHHHHQHQQQQQQQHGRRRGSRAPPPMLHIPSEDLSQDLPRSFLPHPADWSSMPPAQHRRVASLAHRGLAKASSLPLERDDGSLPSAWGNPPVALLQQELSWKATVQPLDRTQSLLPLISETPGACNLPNSACFELGTPGYAGSPLFPGSAIGTPDSDRSPSAHAVRTVRPPQHFPLYSLHTLRPGVPQALPSECPISVMPLHNVTRGMPAGHACHVESFSLLSIQSPPISHLAWDLPSDPGSEFSSPLSVVSPEKPQRKELDVPGCQEGH